MKLFIVAGEASGDLHAGSLAAAIIDKAPETELIGFGGANMKRAGVDIRFDLTSLAVVGLVEVVGKLGQIWRAMKAARHIIRSERPDAVILVDYPGFNLHLAGYVRKLGVPVIYYIAPQVWAWHRSRVKKIARTVDLLMVVFAFEVEFFAKYGIKAAFVGHPLLDILDGRRKEKPAGGGARVGILPGSRRSEVERFLPVMLEAGKILKSERSDLCFDVSCADCLPLDLLEGIVARSGLQARVAGEQGYETASRADVVMVASGTATLETCILGVPMVVLYKVSFLSYVAIRAMIKVSNISLVNLLAGEPVVPELVQWDVTPEKIAASVDRLFEESEASAMKERLGEVKASLGNPGASGRAADEVLRFLESRRGGAES